MDGRPNHALVIAEAMTRWQALDLPSFAALFESTFRIREEATFAKVVDIRLTAVSVGSIPAPEQHFLSLLRKKFFIRLKRIVINS
ncbi:hypothetical protein TNIN_170841 [Trichonephila inaurata madagascariensis]|uniref:Uncharacterized protein n=1 Tax=Trichonephila inaurata madagascariensis TaxID=2747483 RepID=A0A8X6YEM5_9ARAC|nr:hypothetical protein TNIN_170841 [Trichonephila inaurata madagascariensis]